MLAGSLGTPDAYLEGLHGKQPEGKGLESKAENLLLTCDMAKILDPAPRA